MTVPRVMDPAPATKEIVNWHQQFNSVYGIKVRKDFKIKIEDERVSGISDFAFTGFDPGDEIKTKTYTATELLYISWSKDRLTYLRIDKYYDKYQIDILGNDINELIKLQLEILEKCQQVEPKSKDVNESDEESQEESKSRFNHHDNTNYRRNNVDNEIDSHTDAITNTTVEASTLTTNDTIKSKKQMNCFSPLIVVAASVVIVIAAVFLNSSQ